MRYTYKAEDGAGVDAGRPSEASRFEVSADGTLAFRASAQRYLKRIEYGNERPFEASGWRFEVVFDYGEHDEAAPSPREVRPWLVRQDAFSSYRAGFEVRTYRLCRRVLMFHRFPQLGEGARLVGSTDLDHEQGPVLTYLRGVRQVGYVRREGEDGYARAELPPLQFDYTRAELHEEVRSLPVESLEGIAAGVGPDHTQWVDLDGEGIPGVLVATPGGWRYKENRGEGRLGPPQPLRSLPAPARLARGVQQLVDLEGDGRLDLVRYAPPLSGYFTRGEGGSWQPFEPFEAVPHIDWMDPNLRFVDLDGDGLADVLITEQDVFTWYRSRGRAGLEPVRRVPKPWDEREGPAVLFADGTESVHLADMSGDGLVDIVRVRDGEVSYWPNQGHGRFGRKVTLEGSPRFGGAEPFDPRRVRFADIDGSGTSDLVYLGREGVRLYLNQSGNALSGRTVVRTLPPADGAGRIEVVDLLGQGTACLLWSSALPADEAAPVRYVDLMGGRKPHLLTSIRNHLGAETRIAYEPSTRHYLRDEREGRPWRTRLPFVVHVVGRIERVDHVARTRLVTRYRYHHGYFDGHEREFRGFACVEQWDAEALGGERGRGLFPELPYDMAPEEAELRLPPVRTVRWYHTGARLEREGLHEALAREYYAGDGEAARLAGPDLPEGLSVREAREAARALTGRLLREEVYAEDGTPQSAHPYVVREHAYTVRLLQGAHGEGHAVFFAHRRETLELHYERNPADPRTRHELVLQVDEFGHVTRSAAIAYPRRRPEHPEQGRPWVTVTERRYANRPQERGWYRLGVPLETTVSELTGLELPASGLPTLEAVRAAFAAAEPIPYEAAADGRRLQRRLLERQRTRYCRDDLSGPLPFGEIESLALPWETYRQAFTPGLLEQVYGERVDAELLRSEGGYVLDEGLWWAPSGRLEHDPARFYLPVRAIDPFGHVYTVDYDAHALLPTALRDPLGSVTSAENDYRVLAPARVTDPNGNRTAATFDALGRVVEVALMGKPGAGWARAGPSSTTRATRSSSTSPSSRPPRPTRTNGNSSSGGSRPCCATTRSAGWCAPTCRTARTARCASMRGGRSTGTRTTPWRAARGSRRSRPGRQPSSGPRP